MPGGQGDRLRRMRLNGETLRESAQRSCIAPPRQNDLSVTAVTSPLSGEKGLETLETRTTSRYTGFFSPSSERKGGPGGEVRVSPHDPAENRFRKSARIRSSLASIRFSFHKMK